MISTVCRTIKNSTLDYWEIISGFLLLIKIPDLKERFKMFDDTKSAAMNIQFLTFKLESGYAKVHIFIMKK